MSLEDEKEAEAMHPRVKKLLERQRIDQHTENWYAERRLRITASIAAAILGEDPYQTYADAFRKKTGLGPSFKGNKMTRHGHTHEPIAAELFERLTGKRLIEGDVGLVCHRKFHYLAASPDGAGYYEPFLIEIKCPFSRRIQHFVPEHYKAQMQLQMECCDIDVCYFVQYQPPTLLSKGILDIITVKRDPTWMARAIPVFDGFWTAVKVFYETLGQPVGTMMHDYTILPRGRNADSIDKPKRKKVKFNRIPDEQVLVVPDRNMFSEVMDALVEEQEEETTDE